MLLIVAVLLPTAVGCVWIGGRRVVAYWDRRRPAPPAPPLERLQADLRRLHELLDAIENAPSDLPAKYRRCQATRAAYLDALAAACERLEVPAPAGRPVPQTEIYRVEAELRRRGLDVRPAA